MLKASWGAATRHARLENDAQLAEMLPVARREAKAGSARRVYLEKLVRKARHIEVQISVTLMATWCTVRARLHRAAP